MKRFIVGFIPLSFMVGLPAMACVLAAVLLACASSAQGQVIEEGGFPVKGGDNSGEPFSLSCPPRLYVEEGESVSLSCSATAVPEEGVRYAWESLSGDGLHLLSDAQALTPLFTAPLSGEGVEYAYRLTAMSVGVYETATVTVSVEGVPEETVGVPVVQEECDSLVDFEGGREGCVPWEKAPPRDPFGGIPDDEGIVPWPSFPESPGAEGKEFPGSSGAGSFPQAPPRLDCPVAVFLEELETGQVECHAWDAAGEEYLDYSWEPVGSTTRDYLDNPRLIPENSPTPSVIAPETPVYETLESFRSGETTSLYRYRLTATSRATGLSSSSEVEVYVSSSRPGVYCPLEVVVEEGETIALDCEGVDPLSHRMDYDEESASVLWEWEGLWATSTAPLAAKDLSSPLFTAPAGSAGKEYHYIASMTSSASGVPRTARRKVTVRVAGEEDAEQALAPASRANAPSVTCEDAEIYEAAEDFTLDCSVTDEPDGAAYTWTARGSTSDTNDLANTDSLRATFSVPENVDANTDYEYRVTMTVSGVEQARDDITITVKKKGAIACDGKTGMGHHGGIYYGTFESGRTVQLDVCSTITGAGPFSYSWWGYYLSNKDQRIATFTPPNNVGKNTVYRYALTISSPNADSVLVGGGTWVFSTKLTCVDNPPVYEGDVDFNLDCSLTWDRRGTGIIEKRPDYGYTWSPRGDTPDTSLLIAGTAGITPTFGVPDNVDVHTDYEYRPTVSGRGGRVVHEADVTVTVLNKEPLSVACTPPDSVYEGSADIAFDCSASGGPAGSAYAYAWAASGDTQDTSLLSAADIASPTFRVPDEVDENETYEYLLTVSAENAEDATAEVMVRVLNKPAIVIICLGNPYEPYEWDDVFDLDCVASGAPAGSEYVYVWTGRGSTPNTDRLIAGTDGPTPTFDVPNDVDSIETYKYTLAVSAENAEPATEDITVTVRNESEITVTCTPNSYMRFEGEDDFDLNCAVTNEPSDATYSWTGTDIANRISSTTILTPTFKVPGEVDATTTYEYTLTVSAEGVEDGVARVTVTVKDKPEITVTCTGNPYEKYEGEEDFALNCSARGAPGGSGYTYAWTPRGNTQDTALLSAADIASPTFYVPNEVDGTTTYEYLLTASAENAESGSAEVTVTVLNRRALAVVCADPGSVYEGSADITFDCEASGAPSGSGYTYAWTPRGNTQDTALLSATDISSPVFYVPGAVDATTTYEYLLTASAENAESGSAEVTVTVLNRRALAVVCADPGSVYEGSADITFDCEASGAPAGSTYEYEWTPRGDTPDTALLSAADISSPVFYVPGAVDATTTYEYLLTASAENAESGSAEVTVTVLNRRALAVVCADPGSVYEGSADITFDCEASGAPAGSTYEYEWTPRGDTPDTALLSAADIASPTFYVPNEVDGTTTYEYTLTVSAEDAESGSADVAVTVLNKPALAVVCADPGSVYEGSADITFDCEASGAPSGSGYTYAWTPRGNTQDTALLSAADIASPTFYVPNEVDGTTTYEYLLTASAENAESGSAEVTVTVLNRRALAVVCADPGSVYEDSEDIAFDCEASGAPGSSTYEYEWTPRGDTPDTALLIAGTDGPTPTFDVPEDVDATTTYEYTLTVSAEDAESGSADVAVTVLNKGALAVVCTYPGSAYEGSEDITFDCSASGAPGDNPEYTYAWMASGDTQDTALLNATDVASPTFHVSEEVDEDETYGYLLTVSAANAEEGSAEVTVTVLNRRALAVVCADPGSVYEGSADITFDCEASGAPSGSGYTYAWTPRGNTQDTALLSATDGPTPTFDVPEDVDATTTYEYTLTVSAEDAESGSADVAVTVLNRRALAVVCADPGSVYEGSSDITFDCEASGAPSGSGYTYAWTSRGNTQDTALLSATDIASPVFYVPDAVDATTTYEYLLTVSAADAESSSARVTVTVLNKGALAVVCADPGSVYEGSADITFDCEASGAPSGSGYTYAWTSRGNTQDTALLSATDIASPVFYVPDAVDATTTYEYLLTVSAADAESSSARVTVTVLNKGALAVVCADPGSVYEGSADITFDCEASGAPGDNPEYTYAWTPRGNTQDTALLNATDVASPTFHVSEEIDEDETYEYLLTVSAANAEDASSEVMVTVLNKGALAVVCTYPGSAYEGSEDITFDCSASGALGDNPQYTYVWTAPGDTPDVSLLSAADVASPTFAVPEEIDEDETYEYLLTVSAANAEEGSAEVTVTVLNKGALALVCADPGSAYEGSDDIVFDCSASGALGDNPQYTYVWTAPGDTPDVSLLSAADVASPTFAVPEEIDEDETYEYLLTVSAANAEDASSEVMVTVLDRIKTPDPDPVSPPLTSSSAREPFDPSALGVTISASSLRFGVQSADTQVSLDPMTDQISTRVSGPYHGGRMTLAPGGGEALDENGEMDLSIELASPVVLRREGGIEDASIVLSPQWSFAESCEQLSSQAVGGLYTEVTLSEEACRLLLFGGELDLTDVPSGQYTGSMDLILRSGESEETHSVEVDVTVIPVQRVITIGPGGVRFSTSRELPVGLTEEQNLSIYPHVAFLTEEKPNGVFELSNPSLIPLEISVSTRFGYTEATERGREVVVEDASGSRLSDLSSVVDIHPGVLVLMPGEKGLVRYGMQEGALATMADKGYAAFFDVVSAPRQYVRSDQMPEEVAGEKTARVTMRVPGVYVPGEGASQLRAALLSISYVGSLSATFLVETQDHPFAGEVVAYDGDGRELGRRETLVYTRSRVRIPLDRMPEEGAVFLRFMPRGSGRAPEPASVEWDAPRRDIGAADKDRTRTPETLVQKP